MVSDEKGPVEELTDEGSKVVIAGAASLWPYKKLMIAVLPPTLALLIAVIGVWESSNRDRAAAAEAERDRAAEAAEAEKTRAAEVAKEQAAAEKDRQLREAALVLPRYETLLTEVRSFTNSADVCRQDLENWLDPGRSRWNDTSVGTAAAAERVGDDVVSGEVVSPDEPFFTSCDGIGDLDALQLSVDKALVISNPDLQDASIRLENLLVEASDLARHLSRAPRVVISSGQTLIVAGVDVDGRDFRDNAQRLSDVLVDADTANAELIDVVRGVLLPEQ